MKLFIAMLLLVSHSFVLADNEEMPQSERLNIEKRIQPDVKIKIKVDKSDSAESSTESVENKGKVVFENHCGTCHAEDAPIQGIGAPLVTDTEAWKERAKKGLKALVASVENGLNAMPPKGTCADCGGEDFKKAIYYMLPKGVELEENS